MKVLDTAKLSSVAGGVLILIPPRFLFKTEREWQDFLGQQAEFLKRGRLKVGFNFVETVLSDGLCLISDGKGGDCLWANVFQLSAQSALSYLRHHEDVACRQPISATTIGQAYCRCARPAEGKASVACVSRGCVFGKRALFEILYPRAWLRDTPCLRLYEL